MKRDQNMFIHPGRFDSLVSEAGAELRRDRAAARLAEKDHTLFSPDPAEISNRMGWLDSPAEMREAVTDMEAFAGTAKARGLTTALLLGMGGSSLAPYLFSRTFPADPDGLELSVLDSTDPAVVAAAAARCDPARTLYIVSTKSGGTVETLSLFKYFFNLTLKAAGAGKAGEHFAAITDPGSSLQRTAADLGFCRTFLNNPDIGGRFSALSFFGLVPAALMGVDTRRLLAGVAGPADSGGLELGALMGALASEGVDKLTLLLSPGIAAFGPWVEQLLAESTGKEGKGILPVDGEPPGDPESYGRDRLFVHMRLTGDDTHERTFASLTAAGFPAVGITLDDPYDLGREFMRWEVATAVAGRVMGINPFDQPNVESAKVQAKEMLSSYRETGRLPEEEPVIEDGSLAVYGDAAGASIREVISAVLDTAGNGSYVAIQAYLPYGDDTDNALAELRLAVRRRTGLATTVGYGPRFLHSTGQLHKGDGGNGIFFQITTADPEDLPIPIEPGSPGSSVTFGTLKAAQAMGDMRALTETGRRVVRFHIRGGGIPAAIRGVAGLV